MTKILTGYFDSNQLGLDDSSSNRIIQFLNARGVRTRASFAHLCGYCAAFILHKRLCPNAKLPHAVYGTNSKPAFDDGYFFNISHSHNISSCAVSTTTVGIDVEKKRQIKLQIAKRFFSEDENTYIFSHSDPHEAFLNIWTHKESYQKAIGDGFLKGLKTPPMAHDGLLVTSIGEYFFTTKMQDDNIFTLCAKGEPFKLDLIKLDINDINNLLAMFN